MIASRRSRKLSHNQMEPVTLEYRPQSIPALEAAIVAALREGEPGVILDLDPITKLDSAALRELITLLRHARASGGDLALRTTRPDVLRTLSVTALDRVFRVLHPKAA